MWNISLIRFIGTTCWSFHVDYMLYWLHVRYWVKSNKLLKLTLYVYFYSFNVTNRKFLITYMDHYVFIGQCCLRPWQIHLRRTGKHNLSKWSPWRHVRWEPVNRFPALMFLYLIFPLLQVASSLKHTSKVHKISGRPKRDIKLYDLF